jgi:hypothetical protein
MMHILLLLGTVAISVFCRWRWLPRGETWNARWNNALATFCLPPLLLFSASVAVLWMGHHGHMMGMSVSPVGCWLGRLVLALIGGLFLFSLGRALWFQIRVRRLPWVSLSDGGWVRLIEGDFPFAAQVGFWRSQVVVSRGWLDQLTETEKSAILLHERAHAHYRDLVWFFGLGLVRRLTLWLPETNDLWQELLLLREIRADRWAMQDTDPILLAELLIKLTRSQIEELEQQPFTIGFCNHNSVERLEQRVEALVNPAVLPADVAPRGELAWILVTMMPLILVCFHS